MGVLDRLPLRKREAKLLIPADPIAYSPIGVVRSKWRDPSKARNPNLDSEIVLRDDLLEALESLAGFSHLVVVFHLDKVPANESRSKVDVGTVERGVLATRSQLRPNPIGVSVVELTAAENNSLRVRGLDAIDGTPILDVKPYLPPYDSVPHAKLPDWATH